MSNDALKAGARPDKKKVVGEVFSDEQLAGYFVLQAPEGEAQDFHVLQRAYRGLPVEAFSRFLELAKVKGLDLNAKDRNGETFYEHLSQNTNQVEYADTLNAMLP